MTFITFEGGEGSGKSTQSKLLEQSFKNAKIDVVLTREPGGTVSAEKIRNLIVDNDRGSMHPITELLLINAARYEHSVDLIMPSVKAGKVVICDRYVDSTMAYQGFGLKLGKKVPAIIHNYTMPGISPDLTFILDIEPRVGIARSKQTSEVNHYENLDIEFHERVRNGYHEIAKMAPARCCLIDATQDILNIHKQIINVINDTINCNIKPSL